MDILYWLYLSVFFVIILSLHSIFYAEFNNYRFIYCVGLRVWKLHTSKAECVFKYVYIDLLIDMRAKFV